MGEKILDAAKGLSLDLMKDLIGLSVPVLGPLVIRAGEAVFEGVQDDSTRRDLHAALLNFRDTLAQDIIPILEKYNLSDDDTDLVVRAVKASFSLSDLEKLRKAEKATFSFEDVNRVMGQLSTELTAKIALPPRKNWDDPDVWLGLAKPYREVVIYLLTLSPKICHFFDKADDYDKLVTVLREGRDLLRGSIRAEIKDIHDVAVKAPAAKAVDFEIGYRHSLTDLYDQIEIFGLDSGRGTTNPLKIDVAYVSLDLVGRDGKADTIVTPEQLLSNLTKDSVFLVEGVAGGGKTTLMHWITVMAACGQEVKTWTDKDRDTLRAVRERDMDPSLPECDQDLWWQRVPFFFPLRNWGGFPNPAEIDQLLIEQAGAMPDGWYKDVLKKQQRGLLIFDGLDEVPGMTMERLNKQIQSLRRTYKNTPIILSSRPGVVDPKLVDGFRVDCFSLKAMVDWQRRNFVTSWHKAAEASATLRESVAKRSADWTMDMIHSSKALRKLTTVPLLCGCTCYYLVRKGQVPQSIRALMDSLVEILITAREEERLSRTQGRTPACQAFQNLDYEGKRDALIAIAVVSLRAGGAAISERSAMQAVYNTLDRHNRTEAMAQDILNDLILRTGMISRVGVGQIDFYHNTFRAYLAAHHFQNGRDESEVVPKCLDEFWTEVVDFLAVLRAAPHPLDACFEHLLGQGTRKAQLKALRLESLASSYCPEGREDQLDAIRQALTENLKEPEDLKGLEILENQIVPTLEGLAKNQNHGLVAAAVQTLGRIDTAKSREALDAFIGDDRKPVWTTLAQYRPPLTLPAVADLFRNEKVSWSLPESVCRQIDDRAWPILKQWPGVETLDLSHTTIQDFSHLKWFPQLRELSLRGTSVVDLNVLRGLSQLRELSLSGTSVVDLDVLRGLSQLRGLYLNGTSVRDFSALAAMKGLTLYINKDQPGQETIPAGVYVEYFL